MALWARNLKSLVDDVIRWHDDDDDPFAMSVRFTVRNEPTNNIPTALEFEFET